MLRRNEVDLDALQIDLVAPIAGDDPRRGDGAADDGVIAQR
jgi:hypothetical protein